MMIKSKSFIAAVLLSTVLAPFWACTTSNAQFCAESAECKAGQECVGGVCDRQIASPDGAPIAPAVDSGPAAACPSEEQDCVASAPSGWSGPAVRLDQEPGATPSCPENFTGGQQIGFVGLQAAGSCGCSCTDSTNFACQGGAIQGRDGPIDFGTCFGACEGNSCVSQPLQAGTCTSISSEVQSRELMRVDEGVVTAGTCSAGTISSNLQEPSFETQVALCVSDVAAGNCEANSSCVAPAPTPFDEGMCIFQAGEHECPADTIYTERTFLFADYDDQRSCETCSCEPGDVGNPCGSVEIFNDDSNCASTPITTFANLCAETPILLSPDARFTARTTISCRATVDPPIAGAVTGVGATTVCCAP